jgi:hypothetical protein
MSNLVYIKVHLCLIEDMPDFFRKLKRYVGWFRIESQDVHDIENSRMVISFYTDKVKIEEGKSRQVDIEAKSNSKGSWYFTRINAEYNR